MENDGVYNTNVMRCVGGSCPCVTLALCAAKSASCRYPVVIQSHCATSSRSFAFISFYIYIKKNSSSVIEWACAFCINVKSHQSCVRITVQYLWGALQIFSDYFWLHLEWISTCLLSSKVSALLASLRKLHTTLLTHTDSRFTYTQALHWIQW